MRSPFAAAKTVKPAFEAADAVAFLPIVRRLVVTAGEKVMELLKEPVITERKADRSIVTNADRAANDILRDGLKKNFPDYRVLSEETGLEGSPASPFVWVIDPLDGTKAYAKGLSGFSVMVALLFEEKPLLGIVFDPMEKRYYEAVRGEGCFEGLGNERKRCHVSTRRGFSQTPVITSPGFTPDVQKKSEARGAVFLPPVNSVGVKIGYLVRQDADVYLNHHAVHHWDTAPGLVLLEEAGGRLTHWDGSPLTFSFADGFRHPGPTLATNGSDHREWSDFLIHGRSEH